MPIDTRAVFNELQWQTEYKFLGKSSASVLSPVLASIYINDMDKDKKRKGISVEYMVDLKYRGKMENILGNRMRTQNIRENTTGINVRFCTGAESPGMSTGWG